MNKSYLPLILGIAFVASTAAPSFAQGQRSVDYQDPGASGVVDGTDVYQFLDSGPTIDTTRMEEASKKFDSEIQMPSRKRMKNWQEVLDRDEHQAVKGVGAVDGGMGSVNGYAPVMRPAPAGYGQVPQQGRTAGSAVQGSAPSVTGSYYSGNNATAPGALVPGGTYAPPKPKHPVLSGIKNDFVRTAEWIGFPVSDEFLPGEVDASLAGDLPDGQDPRHYVHEEKHRQAPAYEHQTQVVNPSSNSVPPQRYQEEQPPTIMQQ